jgi:hypothetical protein
MCWLSLVHRWYVNMPSLPNCSGRCCSSQLACRVASLSSSPQYRDQPACWPPAIAIATLESISAGRGGGLRPVSVRQLCSQTPCPTVRNSSCADLVSLAPRLPPVDRDQFVVFLSVQWTRHCSVIQRAAGYAWMAQSQAGSFSGRANAPGCPTQTAWRAGSCRVAARGEHNGDGDDASYMAQPRQLSWIGLWPAPSVSTLTPHFRPACLPPGEEFPCNSVALLRVVRAPQRWFR